MRTVADITLISNSTAGVEPRTFAAQSVEIIHVPDTESRSVDGRISTGKHPSTIRWRGGTTKQLQNVTDVRIIHRDGAVLIEGKLNLHHRVPRETDGWLDFDVLSSR